MSVYIHLQGEDKCGDLKDILVSESDWNIDPNTEHYVVPGTVDRIKKVAKVEIDVVEGVDSLPGVLESV